MGQPDPHSSFLKTLFLGDSRLCQVDTWKLTIPLPNYKLYFSAAFVGEWEHVTKFWAGKTRKILTISCFSPFVLSPFFCDLNYKYVDYKLPLAMWIKANSKEIQARKTIWLLPGQSSPVLLVKYQTQIWKMYFFYSFFENLMHAYNILLCFKGYKTGILAHVYDTSTQKAKSRGFSWVWGHSRLHGKFWVSLGYSVRSYQKVLSKKRNINGIL